MALARVTTWIAGQTLTASALNGEFNSLLDNALSLVSPWTGTMQGGGNDLTGVDEIALDNAGAAASATGRIRRNAGALTWHDGSTAGTIPIVLDRDVTTATVANTTAATTVYTFSVPANTLSTNRAIVVEAIGDVLSNAGTTPTLTVALTYGGTTFASAAISAVLTASANRRALLTRATLSANNATNAQVGSGEVTILEPNTVSGTLSSVFTCYVGMHNALTVDSTAAQTLAMTLTHNIADANISARVFTVQVMLL